MLRGEPAYVKNASALHLRPHTAAFSFHRKRSPVSLRLGHAQALTRPRRVIHSPRAASLPPKGRHTSPQAFQPQNSIKPRRCKKEELCRTIIPLFVCDYAKICSPYTKEWPSHSESGAKPISPATVGAISKSDSPSTVFPAANSLPRKKKGTVISSSQVLPCERSCPP